MTSIRILPGRPESARAARQFIAACLPGCPSLYEAMVCVDELAANAIQHSRSGLPGGTFTVRVSVRTGEWLRVDVEDAGPLLHAVPARPARKPDEVREDGRGLVLVTMLADVVGADAGCRWFGMAWHRTEEAPVPAPRPPAPAPGPATLSLQGGPR